LQDPHAKEVELLFSTWGMPELSAEDLGELPSLRAVFYAAGSVRYFARPFLARGIRVFSAWHANAIPVAEFAFASMIYGLKRIPVYHTSLQSGGAANWSQTPCPGAYRSVVGLASLGSIARRLLFFLALTDLRVLAWDPFLTAEEMVELGVERVDSLDTLFRESDLVSLHTPLLPETEGLIGREHFLSMKQGATFLNTARGAIVREAEMIEVLQQRPDLYAILDVTWPEPPAADSALFRLPNVFLSPHVAGSTGPEVERMGDMMLNALRLYQLGCACACEVSAEMLEKMA
jgi:phosphoglycerate dehydrogenase-like enzyme